MACLRPYLRFGVTGCLLFALAGCSRGPRQTKEQLLESGKKYAAQGKHTEAIIQYRNAIKLDPKFGEARYELGQAYLNTSEPAKAMGEFVRAADLLKTADANLIAGQLLLVARRYEDAKTRAEMVLELDSRNVQAQLLKGAALAGLKDFVSAIKEVDDAIRLDPQNARSFVTLGALQVGSGRAAEAEAAFRKAVEVAPNLPAAQMALANFYWSSGRAAEAEAALKRAVEIDANNIPAQRGLATYYISTGRAEQAEAPLKTIAEIEKTAGARMALAEYYLRTRRAPKAVALLKALAGEPAGFAPATVRLAMIDYAQNRTEEAHKKIEAVLAKDAKNGEALSAKARFLMAERKEDEALAAAKAATATNPKSSEAHNILGAIYASRNEVDNAISSFSEVLRLAPLATGAKIELSRLQLLKGQVTTALQLAEEAGRQDPKNPEARLALVSALAATGDNDRAEAALRDLMKEYPKVALVHARLGGVLLAKKEGAAARREFDRALELDPASTEALRGRIASDLDDKNAAGARALIEKRLQQAPKQPDVLLLAAATYAAVGDQARQEAALRKTIDVDPANLSAFVSLARLLVQQGKLDAAKKGYEDITKRYPNSVAANTMIALILEAQNKPAEARKVYEKLIAAEPGAAVAANNLAWIYADSGGNLDVALRLAQTAKQKMPDSSQVDDTLGWVYVKKDMASSAVPILRQSVEKEPQNPSFHYHLGIAYFMAGNRALAKQTLEKALQLKSDFSGADDARKILAQWR